MWAIYTTFSALCASVSSILQKESLKHIHALQLLVTVYSFIGVLSLGLIPFVNFNLNLKNASLIVISSLFVAIASLYIIKAFRHMEVSVVAPFFNLGTIFSAILAVIVFREVITAVDGLGIILLFLGGYILELKSKNLLQPFREIKKSKHIHLLILGILLYSSAFIFDKYVIESIGSISYLFYHNYVILAFYLFVAGFFYKGLKEVKVSIKKEKWLIVLLSIVLFAENLALYAALKSGEVSLVVPLYRTWTLWAVIFGGRLFHENHLKKRALAALLMIFGAALILI